MNTVGKFDTPVQYVKGVGEKRAQLLSKLEIENLYDLTHFYPRTYLDFSSPVPICDVIPGETVCVRATVACPVSRDVLRGRMTVFKTVVTDGSGTLHITIFNNEYSASALKTEEEFLFLGKAVSGYQGLEMTNPIIERPSADFQLRPVYPQTAGLKSKTIEGIMKNALAMISRDDSPDVIPDGIRRRLHLCHERYALSNIHFPSCARDAEIAKRRLIFEELFVLQAGMLKIKKSNSKSTAIRLRHDYTGEFLGLLPFEATNAQKRAIADCACDMKKNEPMNRLVQGDVGSGKTAVAAAMIYSATKNGFQCALMAPTELLAVQHYNTLCALMPGIRTELLTGSVTAAKKRAVKEKIKNGQIDLVVGTHAILTDDVEFCSLGLVVTDEQHRFGVKQRTRLAEKGRAPHVLVMSATPIPRTLSLIIYGDLDVSVIDEMPKGRQKISTYAVDSSYRRRAFAYVKKHLDRGLQGYIVCPLVEEGEADLTAASEYADELSRKDFSAYRVGLLHGKMKAKDKKQVMQDFADGKIQLLVSTTVIEVGIDVPNAVIMLIENAERFGLSQLHQLRGRVGRGKEKSSCILISDAQGENTKKRLDVMCRSNNGFLIADEDLKLRGPGDFFGSRQHGLPKLKIADLLTDMETLKQAQDAAKEVFAEDPLLQRAEHAPLLDAVRRLFDKAGGAQLN